ncbi:MAG TPA: hypothetical protein VGY76_05465 [Solirubrobacteraceae bacterium]|jgi:hypothetical protein|nr:hypothetical protein [Solirubrobacteraceae bacterium]
MSLQEIDRTLQRLRRATEAIGANLIEVELDPNRELLDASALEGESATRWSEASTTLAQLWQWHALLEQLLDRASQLRGARLRLPAKRLQELRELLQGASIELSSERLPLEQRHLLGGAQAALRCTPEELLERSSAAFDQAKTVLAAVGNAWDALLPRLQAARATLQESTALGGALGEGEPPGLDRARERLSELTQKLSKDPLSVSSKEVAELERSLQVIRDDLDSLNEMRRELAAKLADARELLEELRGVAREGADAHRQALAKIVAPAVHEPLSVDGALASQLEDIERIAHHGAWREARAVLEQWTTRAQSLLERARRIACKNRAPLETRNELRGLLDACQAKATRLGLIEDTQLSGLFEQAHDSLYMAPSDLVRASGLVHRYRHALSEHTPPREVLR